MLTPVRILSYMFCAPGVIAMAYLFYLHGTYAETMPSEPQPALGRTHLVYAMHSRRFVTADEAARLNGAERIPLVYVAVYVGIAYFVYRRTHRRQQESR